MHKFFRKISFIYFKFCIYNFCFCLKSPTGRNNLTSTIHLINIICYFWFDWRNWIRFKKTFINLLDQNHAYPWHIISILYWQKYCIDYSKTIWKWLLTSTSFLEFSLLFFDTLYVFFESFVKFLLLLIFYRFVGDSTIKWVVYDNLRSRSESWASTW